MPIRPQRKQLWFLPIFEAKRNSENTKLYRNEILSLLRHRHRHCHCHNRYFELFLCIVGVSFYVSEWACIVSVLLFHWMLLYGSTIVFYGVLVCVMNGFVWAYGNFLILFAILYSSVLGILIFPIAMAWKYYTSTFIFRVINTVRAEMPVHVACGI